MKTTKTMFRIFTIADYEQEEQFLRQQHQEWNYFRKPANATEENPEIFSDNASKRELIRRVSRKRLIPLAVLFLCCVLPNAVQQITARSNPFGTFLFWFWMAMFVLYSVLIGYCGWRLFLLKQKYKNE